MPERTTYVVVPRYPLTDFLFEGMHDLDDIRVISYNLPSRRPLHGLFRAAEVYLLAWLRRSVYLDEATIAKLRAIGPEDVVVFFAIENRKDLQILRKFVAARTQFVWLWNPIRNYRRHPASRFLYTLWLKRSGLKAYTFDPGDACEHGIGLAPQVYRQVPRHRDDAVPRHDVYFLGIDKGRLAALQALREKLAAAGLSTYFHVLPDKRRQYSDADRRELSERWLPYEENLCNVAGSRAILELLQSSQAGPTIRSMEAIFLGKKLITDNQALLESPLYHPSRMFILGRDDLADIRGFMDRPFVPVDPAVLRAHEVEHWIRRLAAGDISPGNSSCPAVNAPRPS